MKSTANIRLRFDRGLLIFVLAGKLAAQPAPDSATPAATASTASAAHEEPVQLSEFQVSGNDLNGYVASETMTGSRVNTKIVNLPYSIVNLTSEFFNDFNITILDENMTYIGGLTGVGIGGAFNLRGFSSTSQMKDGFYRLGRYGLSNIDRVEIIRGPNAAIYGRSSPGGMINFVSLQPKKQAEQEIRLSDGRYDQAKTELYAQGSLDSSAKTYYVFDVAERGRFYPDEVGHIRNTELFGAMQHDFADRSHLKFSAEYFLQVQHAPQPGAPLLSAARVATPDNAATSTYLGYDTALAGINPYGPNSELTRGSFTYTGTYDKPISEVWSARIGAYSFGARRWDFNSNTGWGTITVPLNGGAVTTTRGSLPNRGEIMEDGGGFQADLAAHYYLLGRQLENKTLFTVDLNDYYRYDPTWEYSVNTDPTLVAWAAAGSGRVVTLTPMSVNGKIDYVPTSAVTYFPSWYTPNNLALFTPPGNAIAGGASLNGGSLTRRRTTSLGGNIRQQTVALHDRLIAYVGLRIDDVRFSERAYTTNFASVGFPNLAPGTGGSGQPGGSVVRRFVHQRKPNVGINYQVLPNLHLYASYSEAYFVDQTNAPNVIAAPTYAPFTAKGVDYGVKGSFLEQRLNFTVGGFYTRQYNVSVTDEVETPPGSGNYVATPEQDGDQLCRGWEADLSYVVTREMTVGSSFGRVDSRYTNYGSLYPEAVGRSVNGVAPENGSAYLRYSFIDGHLKGFYVNLLASYVSSVPTQAPNAGDTMTVTRGVPALTSHTDQWKVRAPSATLWNLTFHYKLRRFSQHWDHNIGLTLNNLFDKYYLKTNASLGDRRSVILSYTLTHAGSRL